MSVPDGLGPALEAFAARRPLLVALDFDGVCAPLVDDPSTSRALPGTAEAVDALVGLDGVTVAFVSGRSLESLAAVSGSPAGVVLVGGHGAETGDDVDLPPEAADLLARALVAVQEAVDGVPGASAEHKPTTVVLHTRLASDEDTERVQQVVFDGPAAWDGVHVRTGHDVVELSVVAADKGQAVQVLAEQHGAEATLYAGDDVTDEDAFAVLDEARGDVGVKVGDGETRARWRVDSPEDVTEVLQELVGLLRGADRA
ncbi:trehalose-phosphatase [Aquipuribacter sp. SD81]|uniref:trehalose-phosphatase n=1 Tax=Aquipuribacter sp. SD81 TaxID=3127703 RepID=UPI00301A295A